MMRKINFESFISKRAQRRKPSPIRELQPLLRIPGMVSLGGGMPSPSLFPISELSYKLKNGHSAVISPLLLNSALQYSSSYGLPELVEWLKHHMKQVHGNSILTENQNNMVENANEWEIMVTTGAQDGLSMAFDLFINEGDYVITENPTYSGSIAAMQPCGCNLVGVKTDAEGMIASELKSVLASWNFDEKPLKIMYIIPTGQNPSGSTMTLQRKKEIYDIASAYNLIILEDDPYYNLQLPTESQPIVKPIPSFLSLDLTRDNGRVLRFDSFSKIISSGMRLGWVTGPKRFVEAMQLNQQAAVLHPSGISQAIIYSVLKEWGPEGLQQQIANVQDHYAKRRDALCSIANKHLKGLAEWFVPTAGMFLWFKLLGIEDSNELITKKGVEAKFLMVPGKSFTTTPGAKSPYVRASYSTATDEEMELAVSRLADLLRQQIEASKV